MAPASDRTAYLVENLKNKMISWTSLEQREKNETDREIVLPCYDCQSSPKNGTAKEFERITALVR